MALRDYVNPTWTNDVTKLNATNLQVITDKIYELDSSWVRFIRKGSNETVNNSSVMQNDNDFNVTLDANSTYRIEVYLEVVGSNTPNFKTTWSKGSGITMYNRFCLGPYQAGGTSADTKVNCSTKVYNGEVGYTTDGTNGSSIVENFILTTGASGNTLTLQWAQITANASNTTVGTSSYMIITKVAAY
jgi:hypothetical protein